MQRGILYNRNTFFHIVKTLKISLKDGKSLYLIYIIYAMVQYVN
ncbi:hypothetical protein BG07_4260 [Bacillus pseudomycoides]|nr:hypothetical protein DJ92_674 [Bacillus pseudomycoides]AJI16296.1 hypothetical protein BG07_4260 [Bacillus pseudomycoides]